MKKLAIVSSHPIQYNVPLFKLLAASDKVSIKVFYTWGDTVMKEKYDPGFRKIVEWDIPLLEGYEYCFVKNIAKEKGSHHFRGIDNPTLYDEIQAWHPDFVLVYGWAYKSHFSLIRQLKGSIPVLFRGDSTTLDNRGILKNLLRKVLLSYVYRNVDIAFYTGENNKKYFKWVGLNEQQLVFAPHAVDNDFFSSSSRNTVPLRAMLSIPEDHFIFLFAGKFEPKKNPVLLAEAFCSLNEKKMHLVYVGNGVLEQELKNRFSTTAGIHFLPFQNQQAMPAIYKNANCFVLPSQGPGETWGLSMNEAMASGIPVIASDKCGGAIDLINKDTGYLFESGNSDQLIDAMKRVIKQFKDGHDWSFSLKKKMEVYDIQTIAKAVGRTIS